MGKDSPRVPIPGLGHQDAAVVQSLLKSAGFSCRVHDGSGESPGVVLIRAADLSAVKELLRDYTIRGPRDGKTGIPW